MPSKKVIYECKYCGKEFRDYDECEQCEQSHIRDYSGADTEEIVKMLKQVSESAYGYHIGGMTMGMPTTNFQSLIDEAVKRLLKTTQE